MRRTAVGNHDRSTMQRLLAIVAAVGAADTGSTLAELVEATGLPKATVHRMVNRLVENEVLVRTEAGYELGLALLELGRHVPVERNLRVRALPFMLDLYAATKQTVMLAMLHCSKVLYIETLSGHNARIPSLTGYRQAPHTTALGKVLVSQADDGIDRLLTRPLRPRTRYSIVVPSVMETELVRVREEGIAFDREETLVGLSCTAAPIVGSDGATIAAIAIATPHDRDLTHLSAAARTAAAGIGRAMADARVIPHEHEMRISRDVATHLSLRRDVSRLPPADREVG